MHTIMAARQAVKGVSLLKRGWHEIPEIMCCLGMMGAATVGVVVAAFTYDKEKSHPNKFKYVVDRDTEARPDWLAKGVYNTE